jgi:hypothetical protein
MNNVKKKLPRTNAEGESEVNPETRAGNLKDCSSTILVFFNYSYLVE